MGNCFGAQGSSQQMAHQPQIILPQHLVLPARVNVRNHQPQMPMQPAPLQQTYLSTKTYTFCPQFPAYPLQFETSVPRRVLPCSTPGYQTIGQLVPNQFVSIKIPKDYKFPTEFEWVKEPKFFFTIPDIIKPDKTTLKKMSFQEKYTSFRMQIEKRRVPWDRFKSQQLHVDPQNVVFGSYAQLKNINFYKELKVVLEGENNTHDAGGLTREWMNLAIKELVKEVGLLRICNTKQTAYRFNENFRRSEQMTELLLQTCDYLGIMIGKALFQKNPLKCFLNHTILRQICNQPVHIADFCDYDQELYDNYQGMLDGVRASQIGIDFTLCVTDDEGKLQVIPLKEPNTMVTSANQKEYVQLAYLFLLYSIDYFVRKNVEPLLTRLRNGIYQIIPMQLLEIFEPYELEMMLCGQQVIDVDDWRSNTDYDGYTKDSGVVVWFWEHLKTLPQQRLANLLHFATGTARVPILGFKYLECNRNEVRKFTIRKTTYSAISPYVKSSTCFNRIELQDYPSREILKKEVDRVSLQEIDCFGIND